MDFVCPVWVNEELLEQKGNCDEAFQRSLKDPTNVFLILIMMLLLKACSSVQEAIGVGQPAPDFSLPTADGGSVALDDFIGQQPVLLYFHMAVG